MPTIGSYEMHTFSPPGCDRLRVDELRARLGKLMNRKIPAYWLYKICMQVGSTNIAKTKPDKKNNKPALSPNDAM